RREIHALARLRHPGIVRILDEGVDGGLPWYAMELLDGVTLRQALAGPAPAAPLHQTSWWTQTLGHGTDLPEQPRPEERVRRAAPVPAVLSAVRRLCEPLAFLHGEGIVHCDLKPDNVLVLAGGAPVLVDFGLTAHFGGDLSREEL